MGEVMNFPERIEDFIEQYSFRDDERTYTNGSKLIPVFRVEQAIEHYMPKWIPCSERLPEENGHYLISDNRGMIYESTYLANMWLIAAPTIDVIAWQPLPEPYKEGEHEKANVF